ncbi:MAG TPA: hypothetical protein VG273_27620 [Bryobacteraceae bacterium]|nr:hypothetical protein [Bryobacteraceae bacterium]
MQTQRNNYLSAYGRFRLTRDAAGVLILLLEGAAAVHAQTSKMPTTDAEKIANAPRAGPAFITRDWTLLDWPSSPGGEYRVLRKDASDWSCLPAVPGNSSVGSLVVGSHHRR